MNDKIYIASVTSVSPMSCGSVDSMAGYSSKNHHFELVEIDGTKVLVGELAKSAIELVSELRHTEPKYRHLDDTVLYAIICTRASLKAAGWKRGETAGINLGSSRGATGLFEKYHRQYLTDGSCPSRSSPQTTLGNISSWVAQDTLANGPTISHSITCSTSMHALLNGIAWLRSGMVAKFIVGGSEAALTPFTIAQMQALKIYAEDYDLDYPCRPLDSYKDKNTMVLGEGASVACIEKGRGEHAVAVVEGIGYATETIHHDASISANAQSLREAMKMALGDTKPSDVDVIVMHAPGTVKGDQAELNAVGILFADNMPYLTSNKWKLGHTFAASGMLSLEMAVNMIRSQRVVEVPYLEYQPPPSMIKNILINSVGFGGDAVSVLISAI